MEREQLFFIDIKQYFGKIKGLAISRRGNLCTVISIQQICKKKKTYYLSY